MVIGPKTNLISFWRTEIRDTIQKNEYRLIFSTPKTNISSICIVKQSNGLWKGTIINEFGVKVFDFVSTPQKCELMNVISFLDKWYVKRVIASDIQFIMEIDNPKYEEGIKSVRVSAQDTLSVIYKNRKELKRLPDGKIIYKNKKRAINYTLIRIDYE
jgi:hypothetical protein